MRVRHIAQIGAPVLVLAIAWLALAVVPDRAGAAQDRIAAAEAEAANLSVQFSAARDAADARAALVEQQTGAGVAVPSELDIGTFVSAIDAWAGDARIVIEHLSPTPTNGVGTDTPLPAGTSAVAVSLGARGSYEGLMTFIDSLTSAERIVVLDRVELRSDEESTDILLDLDLRIFTTEPLVAPITDPLDEATAADLDAGVIDDLGSAEQLDGEGS